MITLISSKDNKINDFCININEYHKHMNELISYKIKCGCGVSGNCIKYGWYKRKLIINDRFKEIKLQRIYCKHCKKTHTIIPKFIIPYERHPFSYVLDLVNLYYNKRISKADYELVRYIKIFNKWKRRLNLIDNKLKGDFNKIIIFCSTYFKMCFMQNKIRRNSKLNKVEFFTIELPT